MSSAASRSAFTNQTQTSIIFMGTRFHTFVLGLYIFIIDPKAFSPKNKKSRAAWLPVF